MTMADVLARQQSRARAPAFLPAGEIWRRRALAAEWAAEGFVGPPPASWFQRRLTDD